MEPFVVICETCRARLKVRSAEAIGQIHSCPRCESMVLIAPPASGDAAVAGAASIVKLQSAHRPIKFAKVETPSQDAADMFAAAAVAVLASTASSSGALANELVNVPLADAVAPASVANGSLLTTVWSTRPAMLLAGAAGAALLAVGGLTIALWPSSDVASELSSLPIAAADVAPAPNDTTNVVVAEIDGSVSAPLPSTIAAGAQEQAANPSQAIPDAPRNVATAITSTSEVAAAVPVVESKSKAQTSSPVAHAPIESGPILKIDPLNFDPMSLSLTPAAAARDPGETSLASAGANSSSDNVTMASAELPARAGDRDIETPVEKQTITIRRGPPTSEPMRSRNLSAQLALTVREMNVSGLPLAQFIDQMSDMAGVPITLDPAVLEMTGISPRREVTLAVKDATIERVLKESLARMRMDFAERDGQLIIVRPAAALPASYEVADLLMSGERDAAKLAKLIEQFVSPDSWESTGGTGELAVQGTMLQIKQAEEIQIGLILFCERLRIARGLAPKSRYPIERLSVESPFARVSEKFKRPTTFTFVPWTRLVDVVRDWQSQSGVTMLVDWPALAQLELTPASPVSCSVIGRTWEDSLDGILAPLGLSWWAIDGETIQITSCAKLAGIRRVEFYKVRDSLREQFADSKAVAQSLLVETQKQLTGEAGQGAASLPIIEVDAASGRLIVLGNAAVHRYLTRRLAE